MRTVTRDTVSTLWATLWVIGVLCIFPPVLASLGQSLDSRENVETQCLYSAQPAQASLEQPLEEGFVTAFPPGRHCVWNAESGGTLATQTGETVALISAAASFIGAGASMGAILLSKSKRQRRLSALPLLTIAGLWTVIFLFALLAGTPVSKLIMPLT